MSIAALEEEIDPHIRATSKTERNGVYSLSCAHFFGYFTLATVPRHTGRRTTFKVEYTKSADLMATKPPANFVTRKGVMMTAATVLAVVIRIDKARSAPAMSETKLLAVPPGAHPTKIKPADSSGPNEKSRVKARAVNGMMVYCATKPMSTYFQLFATRLKSATVRVMPMPTIVIVKAGVTYGRNHANKCGA